MMRHVLLASIVGLSACGGDEADGANSTDAGNGGTNDSFPGCGAVISFDPFEPEASSVAPVRAAVNIVGSPGVNTFTWSVLHDNAMVPHTQESSDGSQIGFIAADPGPYYLTVDITGPNPGGCSYATGTLNVLAPNANNVVYRLRAVPPPSLRTPPQEQIIQVRGGGDVDRTITLDPGINAAGYVRSGSASGPGVAAYVKFMPVSAPLAFTELFSADDGAYSPKLLGINHDVLVIPTSPTLAPKLVAWGPTTTSLVVTGGTAVTGTVRNPAGALLAGAKVQLLANGVPSTLATTNASGAFSLRADFPASTTITVKVTPPASSGLPRLEASGAFTLTSPMQINYAAGLQTCDLASAQVRRNGANQAGAKVTVVGSLPGIAGTVMAGASANALGSVRIAATADGTGRLPSTLVPRASTLTAVSEVATGDFAIDALDTSACAVTTIDAPARAMATGVARSGSNNALLPNVRVEASPLGVLALADAQTITVMTNSSGAFTLPLAAAGRYDVRFSDPSARAAQLELGNIASVDVPATATLPGALAIKGRVSVAGSTQPLPATSVQLLCAQCTGVSASRPIAETATNTLSEYRIAVPDPGTM